MEQTFIDLGEQQFSDLDNFPGTSWTVLTEPVPNGSIHPLTAMESEAKAVSPR